MEFLRFSKRKRINKHYIQHKEDARTVITNRVELYAQQYGFKYNRIAIRDTKTRWGSCSSQHNLNFNYRLAFIDPRLLDYVVVHELCHLIHMNHSKQYWSTVENILPNYRRLEKQLRTLSLQLNSPPT